jgi:hypothetical protein
VRIGGGGNEAAAVVTLTPRSRSRSRQKPQPPKAESVGLEAELTMDDRKSAEIEIDDGDGEFLQESTRLIELYGEGDNGDVRITMLDETTVVVFAHGFPFTFPRLVRNGAFIQVLYFGDGDIYRLEFRTKPQPASDGFCHMLLTKGPDVEQISSKEEFYEYTEREDWSLETMVVVKPKSRNT